MNSVAMDALKYSGYMGQGLSSLCNSDQSQALKSMYSSPESHPSSLTSSGKN